MKQMIFFVFFLMALSFAQKNTEKDFSAFEASLKESFKITNDSLNKDSIRNSYNEFEKSLLERSSEKESIYIARENLLNAIKQKDKEQVRIYINDLNSMNAVNYSAIEPIEKEVIYIELDMYKDFLNMLLAYYKTIYKGYSLNQNQEKMSVEKDILYLYVKKNLDKRDSIHNIYYLISDKIEKSDLSIQEQKKLKIMLLVRDMYVKRDIQDEASTFINKYLKEYPEDEDYMWIKKCIYEPLNRMDFTSYKYYKRKENKEHNIKKKFYTGGFGVNLGFPILGFQLGLNDLYRSDLFEAEMFSPNLEFYFQFSRIALSIEYLNSTTIGIYSYGFGLGYVIYDSRYYKIRPYIGLFTSGFNALYKEQVPYVGNDIGYEVDNMPFPDLNNITFGVNFDYKFSTLYFFTSLKNFVSFAITSKLSVSYVDLETSVANGSGLDVNAAIALGLYFW